MYFDDDVKSFPLSRGVSLNANEARVENTFGEDYFPLLLRKNHLQFNILLENAVDAIKCHAGGFHASTINTHRSSNSQLRVENSYRSRRRMKVNKSKAPSKKTHCNCTRTSLSSLLRLKENKNEGK